MKWTIGSKLLVSFGAIAALIVALAVINWVSMSSGIRAVELARDKGYAGSLLAAEINMDVVQVNLWLTDISATRAAEGFADGFDEAAHHADQFHEHLSALTALHPDDAERLGTLGDSFDAFYSKGREMAQQYIDGGPELGNLGMDEFDAYTADMATELDTLITEMDSEAATQLQAVIDKNSQSRMLGVVFALLAAVVATVIAFFLTRAIAGGATSLAATALQIAQVDMQRLTAAVQAVAEGDLTQTVTFETAQVTITSKDEMGDLARAFNEMIQRLQEMGQAFQSMTKNLRNLIGEVQNNAEGVSQSSAQLNSAADQSGVATQQIAQTIGQVATGTVQQAERVQRARRIVAEQSQAIRGIASGAQRQAQAVGDAQHMLRQQLESAIRQVDESATQSAHSAQQAQSAAKTGGDTVRKTVQGMQAIAKATEQVSQRIAEMGQRSGEIGMIVQTIDEIAERTNLLALNAAIEAARAGEHGRGFAVVADEVRKLAEQSARSAQEITQLIKAVQETAQQARTAMEQGGRDVVHGVALATEAEEGLNQIQGVVSDVSTQMASLSKAVAAIGSSRDALLGTMEQVAAIVEENTASTEQLTVTSEQVLLEMEDVAAISEENSAAAEEVSAGAEEVSAQVEQTVASANSLANMAQSLREVVQQFRLTNTDDDLASQVATFKKAHLGWVQRVETMFGGGTAVKREELVSHHDCALGRWYDGLGGLQFGHLPVFQSLAQPHARLHQIAAKAVEASERGDSVKGSHLVNEMHQVSQEIIAGLDALLATVNGGRQMSPGKVAAPSFRQNMVQSPVPQVTPIKKIVVPVANGHHKH